MSLKNLPRHITIRQMPRQINRAVLQKFVEKKNKAECLAKEKKDLWKINKRSGLDKAKI